MKFINADDPNIIYSYPYEVMSVLAYEYCEGNPVNLVDYNGYKKIDITKKLLKTMYDNAKYLYNYAKKYSNWYYGLYGRSVILATFYELVKTKGAWDLKNRKEFKLKKGDYYVFNGSKFSAEDIGNIHFGYIGSVLFSQQTLCIGSGLYQIYSHKKIVWKHMCSYFDQPRDIICIKIGRKYWACYFKRYIYQW